MGKYSIDKQPSEVLKDTAQKCRDLRKKESLSQVRLADQSGVSLGSVKRFERSGHVSMESFLKLLSILKRLDEFDSILKPKEDMGIAETLFSNRTKR